MEKIGFIGYGHMGSALLKGMLAAKAFAPGDVFISTLTPEKLAPLKQQYPALKIESTNGAVVRQANVLFLCVPTSQVHPVLAETAGFLRPDLHLVILSGGLEISSVEKMHSGPITKIMPTLLAEIGEGVTLICHNARVTGKAQAQLSRWLEKIGLVKPVLEEQFEAAADLTSCAPGLLAGIFVEFIRAGMRHGDLSYEESTELLVRTLSGTVRLLSEGGESLDALIARVATPGGATEGGLQVLKIQMPNVFDDLFIATYHRHELRKMATRRQFDVVDRQAKN